MKLQKYTENIDIKKMLLSILFFFFGLLTYVLVYNEDLNNVKNQSTTIVEENNRVLNDTALQKAKNAFYIFKNNMKVGIQLSVLGFLSGGILTLISLFWNGFILGNILYMATEILSTEEIIYYLKHAPTEIFALLLFSVIGLKGFYFYKNIYYKKNISKLLFPKITDFILPTLLLFISSIIEVL